MKGGIELKIRTRPVFRIGVFLASLALLAGAPAACEVNGIGSGQGPEGERVKIIFLHHSTGENVWKGGVPRLFEKYNLENGTDYRIEERIFPKKSPYGWNNYPYDYWKIWVENSGADPYLEEPTLEILTGEYDVIIFKHCFPVSDVLPDTGDPDISSPEKRLENYRLQYEALKKKMRGFPDTKFIIWTSAPRVENTSLKTRIAEFFRRRSPQKENAARSREFVEWVRSQWDEPGDNIFVWDFFELATGGGNFIKKEYAEAPGNSHPNGPFSQKAAAAFCGRIVDVIEGRGDAGPVTGE
jgi:hypothetical protein